MDFSVFSRRLLRRQSARGVLSVAFGGFSGSIYQSQATGIHHVRLWETGGRSRSAGSAPTFEDAKRMLLQMFETVGAGKG